MQNILSHRNVEMLSKIAYLQIMTTKQIAFSLFDRDFASMDEKQKASHVRSISKTLRKLENAGHISRNWIPTLSTRERPEFQPSSAWFMTRKNFLSIKKGIDTSERMDMWVLFEDMFEEAKSTDRYAQNTLRHEIGITDVFLSIMRAVQSTEGITMPFFLRTSPRRKDVSTTVIATLTSKETGKQYQKKLPFNPDALFALRDKNGITFYMIEYDNNTETTHEKLTNKFIAYDEYRKQKLFCAYGDPQKPKKDEMPLAWWLNTYFNLGLKNLDKVGFRTLFVTTNVNRRNDLFMKGNELPTSALFHFTTLEELQANPLGSVWYRKREFSAFDGEMQAVAKARPSVRRKIRDRCIEEMERVSIP